MITTAPALDWRIWRALAIAFLALKLVLLIAARPFMDETYYWLWGQHPALSYFDHPPLIGWTQALASLLGWNTVGLRVFVVLTLIGDVALLYGFARHIAGAAWREMFWASTALFVATPIFFGLTNLALPDHLLVFFALSAIYAFTRFRVAVRGRHPALALALSRRPRRWPRDAQQILRRAACRVHHSSSSSSCRSFAASSARRTSTSRCCSSSPCRRRC